jgi:hypothetical protein
MRKHIGFGVRALHLGNVSLLLTGHVAQGNLSNSRDSISSSS